MGENNWREAITDQIIRLDSPLKQATVVAYIEQQIKGQPYDTPQFWARPDTCSRATWNKWKRDDAVFNEVLAATWEIATDIALRGGCRRHHGGGAAAPT